MAGAAGGLLAGRVSAAGGFGFIGAGTYLNKTDEFKAEIKTAREVLQRGLPPVFGPGPDIGVGFLCWQLEQLGRPAEELLSVALDSGVKAIWFACGDDVGKWVEFVRRRDREDDIKNGTSKTKKKTHVFVQVGSLEDALTAVNDWKVDCLVAQSIESGGHGSATAPPLLTLVSSILSALPRADAPPLLAAGGLATGAHLACMLALGVDGAVFGTRFLLTPESLYSEQQKQLLLRARPGGAARASTTTARTSAIDRARALGWPRGVDGRALRMAAVDAYERGCASLDELGKELREGAEEGDPGRLVVWAGTGVDLMDAVDPAQDVVLELHQQAVDHLKAAQGLIREQP